MSQLMLVLGFCTALCLSATAFGQHEIAWYTIDGGGATAPGDSVGGDYAIAGTIGQPDASSFTTPMTGGIFEVVGGFWPNATATCVCPGDTNGDGKKDGVDIQNFVACLTASTNCSCVDLDGTAGATIDDVQFFVDDLINGATCP